MLVKLLCLFLCDFYNKFSFVFSFSGYDMAESNFQYLGVLGFCFVLKCDLTK